MANKLTFFDKLKLSMDVNDPRRKTVDLLEQYTNTLDTEQERKYVISKVLNNPYFKLDRPEDFKYQTYAKDISDAWDSKYQNDYTPPDVLAAEKNRDKAEMFDYASPRHWQKKGDAELERRAKEAGYTSREAYVNALKKKQREIDFDASLDWGDRLASFMFPRTAEAIREGKYNDRDDIKSSTDLYTDKNVLLDWGENLMYSIDPAGKVISFGAGKILPKVGKGMASKLIGTGSKVASNAANPLIMEAADAAAYDESDNTDRANFNPMDVAMGTGINMGMNKVTKWVGGEAQKPKSAPKKQIETDVSTADRSKIATQKRLATKKSTKIADKLVDAIERGENPQEFIAQYKELQNVRSQPNPKKEFRQRTAKDLLPYVGDYANYESSQYAVPLVSNKIGDAVTEDPQMTRKVLRMGAGPMARLGAPFLNDFIDEYYKSKQGKSEKDKLDDELKLIYGLESWR